MIEIGVVKSVYTVANKKIVAVSLVLDLDQVDLDEVSIQFANANSVAKLSGYKFWPDKREIDLLFDNLVEIPTTGAIAFIVRDINHTCL
jgi:hypothetical protein